MEDCDEDASGDLMLVLLVGLCTLLDEVSVEVSFSSPSAVVLVDSTFSSPPSDSTCLLSSCFCSVVGVELSGLLLTDF